MIRWLDANHGATSFPPPSRALDNPPGLLAAGGDLSTERLVNAYRQGIFPWYEEGQPILWWCPDPRAVIFPGELHVSRSLRRTMKRGVFSVSVNRDFAGVIESCARREDSGGTWITAEMSAAYRRLNEIGYAHSVEVWSENALAGGIYGVLLDGVFFGESMFSRVSDASKVAMVHLRNYGTERGLALIDCQLPSRHLTSIGSRQIPRAAFLELLTQHIDANPPPQRWHQSPREMAPVE